MRHSSVAARRRLLGRERQEFLIALRPPWEAVNPIEPEHMINAENGENFRELPHPSPPPLESSSLHALPVVQGNPPVLTPLLHKWIVLVIRLRRSSTTPAQIKFLRMKKDINTTPAHAKWHVPHQADAAVRRMFAHRRPLFSAQPLGIRMQRQRQTSLRPAPSLLRRQPRPGFAPRIHLLRPRRPIFMAHPVHQ